VVSICFIIALFFVWLYAKQKIEYYKSRYADLHKTYIKYMNKHNHGASCDLCDNRVGCEKYIKSNGNVSHFYICCPFWEHTEGGTI